jgi:ketosteroid isomerase-like protein
MAPADPDRGALEDEVRATYAAYVATRDRIEAGELPWSALAEFFTDDAVFVDPAWGRQEGRAAITTFLDESMAGLEEWRFPEEWTMVDGNRLVSFWWNRLPGARPDGSPYQAPGISIMTYAGDGRFSQEVDLLNMTEVGELLRDSGWVPPATMNLPPARPVRDIAPPR